MEPSIPEVLVENIARAKAAIKQLMYPEVKVVSCKYINDASSAWWSCKLEVSGNFPSPVNTNNCAQAKSLLLRRFTGKGRVGKVCQLAELRAGRVQYYWRAIFLPPNNSQRSLNNFISSASFVNSKYQEPQNLDNKSRNNVCGWIRHTLGKFSKRVNKSTICFVPADDCDEKDSSVTLESLSGKFHKVTEQQNKTLHSVIDRVLVAKSDSEILKTVKAQSYNEAVETISRSKNGSSVMLNSAATEKQVMKSPTATESKLSSNKLVIKQTPTLRSGVSKTNTAASVLKMKEIPIEPENKTLSDSISKLCTKNFPPPTTYQSVTELYRLNSDLETLAALSRLGDCDGETDYATSCELIWVFTHLSKKGLLSLHPRKLHELREYAIAHTSIPKRLIQAFRIERPIGMTVSKSCTTSLHLLCKHTLYVGRYFSEERLKAGRYYI